MGRNERKEKMIRVIVLVLKIMMQTKKEEQEIKRRRNKKETWSVAYNFLQLAGSWRRLSVWHLATGSWRFLAGSGCEVRRPNGEMAHELRESLQCMHRLVSCQLAASQLLFCVMCQFMDKYVHRLMGGTEQLQPSPVQPSPARVFTWSKAQSFMYVLRCC